MELLNASVYYPTRSLPASVQARVHFPYDIFTQHRYTLADTIMVKYVALTYNYAILNDT